MRHIFSGSRYIVVLAVIDTFLLAAALLIYGSIETVRLIVDMIGGAAMTKGISKDVMLSAIKSVDIILLGTVVFIISLGLYKLFIDEDVKIVRWLDINSIDDLKHTLVGAVVIVLSVLFLEHVIAWQDSTTLLFLGAAVALVIAALAYFQRNNHLEQKH